METVTPSGWLSLLQEQTSILRASLHPDPGYFEVSARWDTGQRVLDEHLFYYMARSSCEVEIAGKPLRLFSDDLIWITPGVPFRFRARFGQPPPAVYRFRLTAIRRGRPCRLRAPFHIRRGAFACRIFVQLLVVGLERREPHALLRLRALLQLISAEILSHRPADTQPGRLNDVQQATLRHYLGEHLAERFTAATLARVVRLSPDYFTRLFRHTFGMPPRRWILQQRMAHAAVRLRESPDSISEIAEQLGYGSVFLFSRQFKQCFGYGPRRYRSGGRARDEI